MAKLQPVSDNDEIVGYYFDCPGCQSGHAVYVRPHKNAIGASWEWNNDLEFPSFRPSILAKITTYKDVRVCHLYVRGGQLDFLPDCTHSLAGQTVDMVDLE